MAKIDDDIANWKAAATRLNTQLSAAFTSVSNFKTGGDTDETTAVHLEASASVLVSSASALASLAGLLAQPATTASQSTVAPLAPAAPASVPDLTA